VPEKEPDQAALTRQERDLVKRLAERDGISEDEAASRSVSRCLARWVKKRTGKSPAKVYAIRKRG
jgi:predicted kinase